jgi:hypothetical protein
MATITVDQQKLVMNAFAATFQNNLVSKDIVTWKQYDSEMDDRNGLKVAEQVGPRYAVTTTTSGVADLSSGVQDSVFGSEQFVVNKTFGASMGWGDFVKIRDIGSARESEALKNAATNLAEVIDAYVVQTAALASNNWVGTIGNNVATYADMATAYTRLKKEGVEDADLRAVLSYDDRQALGTSVVAYAATDNLSTQTFRNGFAGEVDGIPTMFTQQLPSLTVGSRVAAATSLINGASQNVNYKDVAVSAAPGQYMTQTISIDGQSGSTTLKAGEVFTIAGVFAYDNRKQAALPHLQQFVVVADATASSGATAALRIFPAMIVPASGSGGDVNVNTAHATVTAAPADNAVITHLGTASTAYVPRMVLQKQAIIVNTADLIMPATGQAMRKQLTQVPLSIRMWQDSTFATGAHQVRFDVALTANVRERRRICRLNGA